MYQSNFDELASIAALITEKVRKVCCNRFYWTSVSHKIWQHMHHSDDRFRIKIDKSEHKGTTTTHTTQIYENSWAVPYQTPRRFLTNFVHQLDAKCFSTVRTKLGPQFWWKTTIICRRQHRMSGKTGQIFPAGDALSICATLFATDLSAPHIRLLCRNTGTDEENTLLAFSDISRARYLLKAWLYVYRMKLKSCNPIFATRVWA